MKLLNLVTATIAFLSATASAMTFANKVRNARKAYKLPPTEERYFADPQRIDARFQYLSSVLTALLNAEYIPRSKTVLKIIKGYARRLYDTHPQVHINHCVDIYIIRPLFSTGMFLRSTTSGMICCWNPMEDARTPPKSARPTMQPKTWPNS